MSHLQLLSLPVDVLFIIFRHVPLKDKLHTLSKMPEFRPFLKHRVSYLDTSAPFSLKYIQFLHGLQPGWYFSRKNAFHRFYMQIDETTLHVNKYHFVLQESQRHHRPNTSIRFYRETLDDTVNDFVEAFSNFKYFEDKENLLTYHIEGYGYIVVHYDPFSEFQEIYLNKLGKYLILFQEPKISLMRSLSSVCRCFFEVSFTREKKLIASCIDPKKCQCRDPVQEIEPITLEMTTDFKFLFWEGADPIPQVMCSEYRLKEDEYVEGFGKFH